MALMDPHVGPWGDGEAAHLARRAGFGATPTEISAIVSAGMDASVDSLVDFQPVDQPLENLIASLPDDGDLGLIKNPQTQSAIEGWWIFRMVHTTQPLQEHLTLFFHDHLVSGWTKVVEYVSEVLNAGNDGSIPGQYCSDGTLPPDSTRRFTVVSRLLLDQNNLLRTTGTGPYRTLMRSITRDPAMLLYLDNILNEAGQAQENYAREIMELFTMGEGNYSEDDVREVARAFTGEGVRALCSQDWPFTHEFHPEAHDTDPKTVFGESFNFSEPGKETDHVIDLILEHISGAAISPAHSTLPATALHTAWKLLKWFVHETIPIDHPAVAELGQFFHTNEAKGDIYNIRETLRMLLKSQLFYSPEYRQRMHRHPADYVIMAMRNLSLDETSYTEEAASAMMRMGMQLFDPPNVAGWNHGDAWIASGTLINRLNFADRLSSPEIFTDSHCDNLLTSGAVANETDHAGIIEHFRSHLTQAPLRPEEEAALHSFLASVEGSGGDTASRYRRKVRGTLHLVMSLPQCHLK